jgi:antitoxin component YwqK of YwqJK toxin-antitoxin module
MGPDNILDIAEVRDQVGKILPECHRKNGSAPDGLFVALRENGQFLLEITYRQGVTHGPYRDFWSNGKVACEGQFGQGKQEGPWRFFDEGGALTEIIHFRAGKVSERKRKHDQ